MTMNTSKNSEAKAKSGCEKETKADGFVEDEFECARCCYGGDWNENTERDRLNGRWGRGGEVEVEAEGRRMVRDETRARESC